MDFSLDFPRGKASQRQMKVQEILRAALVEILQRGLTKEPILDNSMITITYVDVSPDLKHAKFIFLPFDEEKKDDFIKGFKGGKLQYEPVTTKNESNSNLIILHPSRMQGKGLMC